MRKSILAAQMRRSVTCAFAQQKSICALENKIPSFLTSQMFLPAQMRKCAKKNTLSAPSLSLRPRVFRPRGVRPGGGGGHSLRDPEGRAKSAGSGG
jgi:hypothetical protein